MYLDPAAGNAFAPGYVFLAMLLPIGAHLVHEPLPLLAGLRGLHGDDEVFLDVPEAVITLDGFASLSVPFLPLVRVTGVILHDAADALGAPAFSRPPRGGQSRVPEE
jgi:hypothetical protein